MFDTLNEGKFHYPNGATYTGQWKYLLPPTPVEATPPPKSKKKEETQPPPQPDPSSRVRHGKGVYQEGAYIYDGEWADDQMHGVGKFTFASGATYEGSWVNNKYHGRGTYTWPDGRLYQGDWQEGRMHGPGTYTDVEGHQWCGQFHNGSGPGLTCLL